MEFKHFNSNDEINVASTLDWNCPRKCFSSIPTISFIGKRLGLLLFPTRLQSVHKALHSSHIEIVKIGKCNMLIPKVPRPFSIKKTLKIATFLHSFKESEKYLKNIYNCMILY